MRRRRAKNVAKASLAGVLGGLAGAWTMNQYSTVISKVGEKRKNSDHEQEPKLRRKGSQEDDATMKTAERLYGVISHRRLTKEQKKKAGPIVHYSYGAILGGIYGALSSVAPTVTAGAGTAYGSAVWLGGDEVAVPAFGLSKPPNQYPVTVHAKALGSHLVYGATLDLVRRGVQAIL